MQFEKEALLECCFSDAGFLFYKEEKVKKKKIAVLIIAGFLLLCLPPQIFGGKIKRLEPCWDFLHEFNGWVRINTDYREFIGIEAVDKAGNVHNMAFQPNKFKIPSDKFVEIKIKIRDKVKEFDWELTFPLAPENQQDESEWRP